MKKKIQKYLSGEREGFSLVELIIVIAIMAILIGVVALAVLPYLERSRESKDKQALDTVYNAFMTALAEEKVAQAAGKGLTNMASSKLDNDIKTQVETNLGMSLKDAEGNLVSANAKGGEFCFTYSPKTTSGGTGTISVSICKASGDTVSVVKDGNAEDFTVSNIKPAAASK